MQTVSTRAEYDSAMLQCKARYGLVVVDFFAPWCAGCRCMYPKLRQIAANNLDVAFIKVRALGDSLRMFSRDKDSIMTGSMHSKIRQRLARWFYTAHRSKFFVR